MGQNNLISIDLSMLIQMINFFIMVFVFWKFFGKKIGKVLEQRRKIALSEFEKIEQEREKLEEQRVALEKLRKESKRRANDIIIKAERQADERREQIILNANTAREKSLIKAEADIVKMKEKARAELQQEIGDLAVELAQKILKENIDKNEELQNKSIDKFINEIGE